MSGAAGISCSAVFRSCPSLVERSGRLSAAPRSSDPVFRGSSGAAGYLLLRGLQILSFAGRAERQASAAPRSSDPVPRGSVRRWAQLWDECSWTSCFLFCLDLLRFGDECSWTSSFLVCLDLLRFGPMGWDVYLRSPFRRRYILFKRLKTQRNPCVCMCVCSPVRHESRAEKSVRGVSAQLRHAVSHHRHQERQETSEGRQAAAQQENCHVV